MELIKLNAMSNNQTLAPKSIIAAANDLAVEHENFYQQYILGGRSALYQLIGKIYELSENLIQSSDKCDQVNAMRNILSKKYKIRTQENSSDLSVLIRYITRIDRKTAHVYARVIETARLNQLPPALLPKYLEQNGGLEGIQRIDAKVEKDDLFNQSFKGRCDLARQYLIARKEYPVTSFKVSSKQANQLGVSNNFSLLLSSESNGRYFIYGGFPIDGDFENKILQIIGERLPNEIAKAKRFVDHFYKKAMKKRQSNTLRKLIRKRPAMAEGMIRTGRIRSLGRKDNLERP